MFVKLIKVLKTGEFYCMQITSIKLVKTWKKEGWHNFNKIHLSYRAVSGTQCSIAIYTLNTPKAYTVT